MSIRCQRLSSTTPPSFQEWLDGELEKRYIDPVYTRYILSILQEDSDDVDSEEFLDICKHQKKLYNKFRIPEKCSAVKSKHKRKFSTKEILSCEVHHKLGTSNLERKCRNSAINCLKSVSDDNTLEDLIDEVILKLKDLKTLNAIEKNETEKDFVKHDEILFYSSPTSPTDQIEKYFAEFPPLNEKPEINSLCQNVYGNAWHNNKIVNNKVVSNADQNYLNSYFNWRLEEEEADMPCKMSLQIDENKHVPDLLKLYKEVNTLKNQNIKIDLQDKNKCFIMEKINKLNAKNSSQNKFCDKILMKDNFKSSLSIDVFEKHTLSKNISTLSFSPNMINMLCNKKFHKENYATVEISKLKNYKQNLLLSNCTSSSLMFKCMHRKMTRNCQIDKFNAFKSSFSKLNMIKNISKCLNCDPNTSGNTLEKRKIHNEVCKCVKIKIPNTRACAVMLYLKKKWKIKKTDHAIISLNMKHATKYRKRKKNCLVHFRKKYVNSPTDFNSDLSNYAKCISKYTCHFNWVLHNKSKLKSNIFFIKLSDTIKHAYQKNLGIQEKNLALCSSHNKICDFNASTDLKVMSPIIKFYFFIKKDSSYSGGTYKQPKIEFCKIEYDNLDKKFISELEIANSALNKNPNVENCSYIHELLSYNNSCKKDVFSKYEVVNKVAENSSEKVMSIVGNGKFNLNHKILHATDLFTNKTQINYYFTDLSLNNNLLLCTFPFDYINLVKSVSSMLNLSITRNALQNIIFNLIVTGDFIEVNYFLSNFSDKYHIDFNILKHLNPSSNNSNTSRHILPLKKSRASSLPNLNVTSEWPIVPKMSRSNEMLKFHNFDSEPLIHKFLMHKDNFENVTDDVEKSLTCCGSYNVKNVDEFANWSDSCVNHFYNQNIYNYPEMQTSFVNYSYDVNFLFKENQNSENFSFYNNSSEYLNPISRPTIHKKTYINDIQQINCSLDENFKLVDINSVSGSKYLFFNRIHKSAFSQFDKKNYKQQITKKHCHQNLLNQALNIDRVIHKINAHKNLQEDFSKTDFKKYNIFATDSFPFSLQNVLQDSSFIQIKSDDLEKNNFSYYEKNLFDEINNIHSPENTSYIKSEKLFTLWENNDFNSNLCERDISKTDKANDYLSENSVIQEDTQNMKFLSIVNIEKNLFPPQNITAFDLFHETSINTLNNDTEHCKKIEDDTCNSSSSKFDLEESEHFGLSALYNLHKSNSNLESSTCNFESSYLPEYIDYQEYSRNDTISVEYDNLPYITDKVHITEDEELDLIINKNLSNKTYKQKFSSKRPCVFYVEGNCKNSACNFSHDLAHITCRFWEQGSCFKGITCPFLHGYAKELKSPARCKKLKSEPKFSIDSETDFPTLSSVETEKVFKKPRTTGKVQDK